MKIFSHTDFFSICHKELLLPLNCKYIINHRVCQEMIEVKINFIDGQGLSDLKFNYNFWLDSLSGSNIKL